MFKKAIALLAPILITALLVACNEVTDPAPEQPNGRVSLDDVAERYVKLALAFRPFDEAYVDAYFGPEAWADAAESEAQSLAELQRQTEAQLSDLVSIDLTDQPESVSARKNSLEKRLRSMSLRMRMADGYRVAFDEESSVLFDAQAPTLEDEYFARLVEEIDALVPGDGGLNDRIDAFRNEFVIPTDKLEAVFSAAIDECRRRTLAHIELPADEDFTIEFVTDQPWSGYNWYQGAHKSLIQINTDLPIYIDRAVDLGCHEGYPGHHTYNVLVEQQLVNGRDWIEFTLMPLYGPMSLISEGSANYGIELAFSDAERRQFEQDVLFPLAGLDTVSADRYHDLLQALQRLSHAGISAARRYLNGDKTADETAAWLRDYALSSMDRAEQRVRFFDTYRSYIINYSLGRDLIDEYLNVRVGNDRNLRWQEFERLLSRPVAPSDLR